MEAKDRNKKDEFRRKLKEDWKLLWKERFDDKVRAEGVAVRDYPLLLLDSGFVVFAIKDAKIPRFSEIVEYWSSQGQVYDPDPSVGGWGKFIRTTIAHKKASSRVKQARQYLDSAKLNRQLKKNGRGWLHKE